MQQAIPHCQRREAAETFEEHRTRLGKLCRSFQRMHGGDMEELVSESHLHFCQAFANHNGDKAPWNGWIRYKVWHGLLERARCVAKRNKRFPTHTDAPMENMADSSFQLDRLLLEVSPDARAAMLLALNPPLNVRLNTSRDIPKCRRKGVKLHLQDMGWDHGRIERAFNEVCKAINEYRR